MLLLKSLFAYQYRSMQSWYLESIGSPSSWKFKHLQQCTHTLNRKKSESADQYVSILAATAGFGWQTFIRYPGRTIMHKSCKATGTLVEPEKSIARSYYRYHLRNWAGHRGNGIRLPVDKLARLVQSLKEWRGKKACRKRELLSIIGLFSHACKVIRPGRSFLCRLIDLSSKVSNLDHFVRSLGTDLWGKSKVL